MLLAHELDEGVVAAPVADRELPVRHPARGAGGPPFQQRVFDRPRGRGAPIVAAAPEYDVGKGARRREARGDVKPDALVRAGDHGHPPRRRHLGRERRGAGSEDSYQRVEEEQG